MATYFFGVLAIAMGAVLIIYTEWFIENFGRSEWAEAKFALSGGSRMLYKLVGLAMIFLSLMWMTGLLQGILLGFFGNLFGL
ncbi:hypothetical protein KKG22_05475 [Patescibacteria group bacterium]|nr:hypothetical protein [Patescibacteria group bacterium]MBU1721527.1 hypothetical protein [Patescibacteria group bacterium]MBU1901493.1 hypothetical protein [Patescibacteria group bacterium]